jgi:hypothetical protein
MVDNIVSSRNKKLETAYGLQPLGLIEMAEYRPKIKRTVKEALIKKAGGKCANPGCPNVLTEIHHIKEWCVYKSHNPSYMIAICPSCHDSVTRGGLRINDETLYRWKTISRALQTASHYIYLEPGAELPKLGCVP